MRQAGVCAAACVYALDHHVDRLADDHANARALARGLSQIQGIEVQQPETNLVFFKPDGAGVSGDDMVKALRAARRAARRRRGRLDDQGLHPSRRFRRDDRGDGRPGARDRARGVNSGALSAVIACDKREAFAHERCDEAIHSFCRKMDCFASLAMTRLEPWQVSTAIRGTGVTPPSPLAGVPPGLVPVPGRRRR